MVMHGGAGDPFWVVVIKGMNDAAKLLNVDATYSSPTVYSVEEMVNLLNTAIAAKPDGIAVSIVNPQALDQPLRRAISSGIPVIAVNVPDTRPADQRIPYLFYVGAFGYDGGVANANLMLRTAKAQGKTITRAVCAEHETGHADLEARCQGLIDTLKGIPVDKLAIGTDPTAAVPIIDSYFKKNPDANAMMTVGPLGTIPALQWLNETNNAGKIFWTTFDMTTETLNAIKSGALLSTVDQQQYMQGYLPIVFLNLYHNYLLTPSSDIKTGPFLVTKDNVDRVMQLVAEGYR
jgi:simple sugar transport system substrate-binding protein